MTNEPGAKRINVPIDRHLHKKVKVKATTAEMTWEAVVSEALQGWLDAGSPSESDWSAEDTTKQANDATVDKRTKKLFEELLGKDDFLWLRKYRYGRKSPWSAVLVAAMQHWIKSKRPGKRVKT